jgi:peptidoglycan/xylan/chitin deacetylase (PgdA/CDA1 family)
MIFLVVEPLLDGQALRYAARELLLLARFPHRILTYREASERGSDDGVVISYGHQLPPPDVKTRIHIFASGARWTTPPSGEAPGGTPPILHEDLPVLCRGQPPIEDHVDRLGDCLVTDLDLLASAFLLLSRGEELRAAERDRFGRFPAERSAAAAHSFLTRPIVNEYAALLATWIEDLDAGETRRPPWHSGFALCVTHDIDQLALFSSARQLASVARRILRGPKALRRLATVAADGVATLIGRRKDPFDTFGALLAHERSRRIPSTYFVMAGGRGPHEGRYRLSDAASRLETIAADGHELGIHGSLRTWRDGNRLAQEITALERVVGDAVCGGRQHYLRVAVPETWVAAAASGLRYDASLGYPESIGFRGGICTPLRPFDSQRGEEIPLWVLPLTVMDATLQTAMGLGPEEGIQRTLDLAATVAQHHGLFVLLWHNASLYDALYPGWGDAFPRILDGLLALGGEPMRMCDAVERWERHIDEVLGA